MSRKRLLFFSHVARQKNHEPNFTFFNFTSDVHNKNHHLSPNSHWNITAYYTESTILEDTRSHMEDTKITSHGQTISPRNENDLRSWYHGT